MTTGLITTFAIRTAALTDVADIIDVMQAVYAEHNFVFNAVEEAPDLLAFEKYYDQESSAFFVALIEGKTVGTIGVHFTGDNTAEIFRLYLAAHSRGMGIGRRLLNTAVAWARERGARRVVLWSDRRFVAAHPFYEKVGFRQGTGDGNDGVDAQFVMDL